MAIPREILKALNEFGVDLSHCDRAVETAAAQIGIEGFIFNTFDVIHLRFLKDRRTEFEVIFNFSYDGHTLAITIHGVVVKDVGAWEVDTYTIIKVETDAKH